MNKTGYFLKFLLIYLSFFLRLKFKNFFSTKQLDSLKKSVTALNNYKHASSLEESILSMPRIDNVLPICTLNMVREICQLTSDV